MIFELIFMYDNEVYFFPVHGYTVTLAQSVEKILLSPLNCLGIFVKNEIDWLPWWLSGEESASPGRFHVPWST